MASTAPAKSQPLHNFSLPHLKWTKNHTNNHQRGRRFADSSPRRSPPSDSALRRSPTFDSTSESPMRDSLPRPSPLRDSAPRQSPMRDFAPPHSPKREYASESDSGYPPSARNGFMHETWKKSAPPSAKRGSSRASSSHMVKNFERDSPLSDSRASVTKEVKSKIVIRLPANNKPDGIPDEGKSATDGGEMDELAAKTWNLRPRRPIYKQSNAIGGTPKVGGPILNENKTQLAQAAGNRSELACLRSDPGVNGAEKRKKQKLSVMLSRGEIEEDIFAMTGSKPARRPKKRTKNVQKCLDNLFPGLWLSTVTPELYKVSETPLKG